MCNTHHRYRWYNFTNEFTNFRLCIGCRPSIEWCIPSYSLSLATYLSSLHYQHFGTAQISIEWTDEGTKCVCGALWICTAMMTDHINSDEKSCLCVPVCNARTEMSAIFRIWLDKRIDRQGWGDCWLLLWRCLMAVATSTVSSVYHFVWFQHTMPSIAGNKRIEVRSMFSIASSEYMHYGPKAQTQTHSKMLCIVPFHMIRKLQANLSAKVKWTCLLRSIHSCVCRRRGRLAHKQTHIHTKYPIYNQILTGANFHSRMQHAET